MALVKLSALLFALFCAMVTAAAQETYGTIRATTRLRPDGTTSTTVMDPEKGTAEETISDSNGKALRKTTYILGERNISVGAIFADAKGKEIYKASYKRDGLGRIVETVFNSPDDRYLGKRIFVYGSGETVTRVEDYDAQGQLIAKPQAAGKPTTTRKRR
jgi:hypothetical protein